MGVVGLKWRCPFCGTEEDTGMHGKPLGWYRLGGWRNTPRTYKQGDCPVEVPGRIICPGCAKVLRRALDFLCLPYDVIEPNTTDCSRPISLGLFSVNA